MRYYKIFNPKQISLEEMNQIVAEKIPLEERLRSVYLPIIVMDCACYLSEDALSLLRSSGMEATKKVSRVIRYCIDGYRRDNCQVMRSDLYNDLTEQTKKFYVSLSTDMIIYQIQYQNILINRDVSLRPTVTRLIAVAYVVRELMRFVIDMDRMFTKRISDLLGRHVKYTTEDNEYCLKMIKALEELLDVLNIPKDLSTTQTETAFKVFKNKINSIQI